MLLSIAKDPGLQAEHAVVAPFCDDQVLNGIIDLAWRHQFDEERHGFRRGIRELQEYVSLKAREAREGQP